MTGDEVCWVELVANEKGEHRVHVKQDCVSLKLTPNTELKKYVSRNEAAKAYAKADSVQVFDCEMCKLNL